MDFRNQDWRHGLLLTQFNDCNLIAPVGFNTS
jgi:hypothetical protein